MLTAQQKAHFETFGFLVLRQLFSAAETEKLTGEYEGIMHEDRGGRPFKGERQSVQPFVEKRGRLLELAKDNRVYNTVEDLLGPGFVWVGCVGNYYVGDTPWHADGLRSNIDPDLSDWYYPIVKVGFYLDPVAKDTGCLRVIPGSHKSAYADGLEPLSERNSDTEYLPFGVSPAEVPGFPLETEPGDVFFFNEDIHHGSFGGIGRRMFAISFITRPSTDEHAAFLRRAHASTRWTLRPHEALVNSENPRLRGMVEPLLELGFETQKG